MRMAKISDFCNRADHAVAGRRLSASGLKISPQENTRRIRE
jgi:hypothetical protein